MSTSADWGGLRAITVEAKEIQREQRRTPVVACPICGTPVQERKGEVNCPMGHYRGPVRMN